MNPENQPNKEIIYHFFSKTKLSEHIIDEIKLINKTKNSYIFKLKLIPNKLSNQPKRDQTTLEININKIRDYKLNKILKNES